MWPGAAGSALTCALVALLGCSREAAGPEPRTLLELEARAALGELREPVLVERRLARERWRDWAVESQGASYDERTGALVLTAEGPRKVVLAGPIDLERTNEIVIDASASSPELLRLALVREGRPAHFPPAIRLGEDDRPRRISLADARGDGPYEELWLVYSGESARSELTAVEFHRRPLCAFLPDASSEPERVTIGRDSRPAVGVFSGAPLRARFHSCAAGSVEFACGVPEPARADGVETTLVVRLSAAAGERATEIPLAREPGWRWVSLSLADLGEGPARASFELVAGGSEEPLGCAISLPEVHVARAEPETVLLVTSDTHRADYLGVARSGVEIETPALDALAARGVLFTDCSSCSNSTNPSHVAIMTATHPRDTGVIDNASPLSEQAPTLAEAFHAAGWTTLAVTSASHLSPRRSGLGQGFDRFASPRPNEGPSFDAIAHLSGWLDEVAGRRLFVWVHLFDAHTPYRPREPWWQRYYGKDVDPRSAQLPQPSHRVPDWARGVRDMDYLEALYRGEVSWLDQRLSAVFAVPRVARGVIAFTGDHGEHLGVDDGWFNHHLLYPDRLRVPLLLAGPGVPRGRRSERRVQNTDLSRTLLALAGLSDVPFPGTDLLAGLRADAPDAPPRFALCGHGNSASIEAGRWYLVLHLEDETTSVGRLPFPRHTVELFDLERDPACERDLVSQAPQRARVLRRRLIDFLVGGRESGWNVTGREIGEEERDELAALGYAPGTRDDSRNDWFDPDCRCERCRRWD